MSDVHGKEQYSCREGGSKSCDGSAEDGAFFRSLLELSLGDQARGGGLETVGWGRPALPGLPGLGVKKETGAQILLLEGVLLHCGGLSLTISTGTPGWFEWREPIRLIGLHA